MAGMVRWNPRRPRKCEARAELKPDPLLKKAIVTGATGGIGAATVRALTASGLEVLAVGRRAKRLKDLAAETGCMWLASDVRDCDRLAAQIEAFEPDIVINNAGVGHGISGLAGLELDAIQEAFEVNVIAPIQICSLALPGMRRRGRGHVINIGSIAGLHTLLSAIYGGTKSAIHRFSQNLRFELRGSGIRVTEICPGRVASDFYQSAAGDKDKLEEMSQTDIRELRPEDIANVILFALNAPPRVNISTIEVLPTEQAVGGVDATPVEFLA